MDARFYNSEEIDIEKAATDLENMFRAQSYQTQQVGTKDQMMVQLKKGGDLAALVGLQTALTLTLQRTNGGVVAMIGQQKWVDKAAVGAVGLVAAPFIPILWPLLITAGAGAIKQAALGNQVLNTVDGLVRQQIPGIQAGPLPGSVASQFQQYWAQPPQQYVQPTPTYVPPTPVYTPPTPAYTPPTPTYVPPTPVYTPTPAKPRCPSCNTPYETGDTFCSGCGRGLTPPKLLCPSCKAELKPGVAFCPSCGANTFQSTASQPAKATPAPAKPSTPVYTPPKPSTPVYTPPKSATPVYTPPTPRPATPVYTPPTKPVEPAPYVPPVPKDPPVVPQPSVTLVPGPSRPTVPAQPPKAPPVPVYIPPVPFQPPTIAAQPQPLEQTPPMSQTIKAQPTNQEVGNANLPWGTLIFSNGREVTLTGERVLVGRYDHDLGGVQPEVDLGDVEGADTASRGHATIEHIGSTYQVTDLNSTNFTRVNGKRLEPSVPTPISDGDTLQFGKIQTTFKKS